MREELTDGRVCLRRYRGDDARAMFEAAVESVKEVFPWLPWCHEGYTLAEAESWIAGHPASWEKDEAYNFLIEDAATRAYAGGISINAIHRDHLRANLGYWVRTSRSGQGFAPAATRLLARWAIEELGLKRIEIVAAAENRRSQRVAEKAGAAREGVLRSRLVMHGVAHDAVMYSIVPADLGIA